MHFLNWIEESLNGLFGIIHHDKKILGPFLLILVGLYWRELEGESDAAGVTGTDIAPLRKGAFYCC